MHTDPAAPAEKNEDGHVRRAALGLLRGPAAGATTGRSTKPKRDVALDAHGLLAEADDHHQPLAGVVRSLKASGLGPAGASPGTVIAPMEDHHAQPAKQRSPVH
jgi:hypothetical protein